MKSLIIIAAFLFLGSFTSKQIIPTQSDVDRVSSKFPGYTLTELINGNTLFDKHCGICHGLKDPTSKSEAQWVKIVPVMSNKVNKKEGNVLDEKAQESILRYVITMSTATPAK
jgi:hypothetical protein